MTDLVVRRLLVDLEAPIPRLWCGGDAFATAFFDALSMSFPAGEQAFIDSLRAALDALPPAVRQRHEAEVRGFIGQEATHRRIHERFNAHLARRGLVNRWERRIAARRALLESLDVRNWVAVTASTEHLTAIFAERLLAETGPLADAEPRLRDLWLWHSAEESEHRATAFDLYLALGGDPARRASIHRSATVYFAVDLTRQVASNLWRDGTWWRPSTWAGAWRLLLGRRGLLRAVAPAWRDYLRADFHPLQRDGDAGRDWLAANAALAPPVAAGRPQPAAVAVAA